jgi:GNAT superfamily N-acetyltransferase
MAPLSAWRGRAPGGWTGSTSCPSGGAGEVGRALHDEVLSRQRADGRTRCNLWVLEENARARRFYERLGWRENGDTRVVPFPPHPTDVGYSIEL